MVIEKKQSIGKAQIHYLEAGEDSNQDILFLHGMKFSSETWNELGTLSFFESNGFHALAIDLPGFGKSDDLSIKKESVLLTLMDKIGIEKPFIVAPSFSGGYSLPVVVSDPSKLSGFVGLAPTNVPDYAEKLLGNPLPTLAVWGSNDEVVPLINSDLLCEKMSNIRIVIFENAGHPCYLTETEAFHKELLMFFNSIG